MRTIQPSSLVPLARFICMMFLCLPGAVAVSIHAQSTATAVKDESAKPLELASQAAGNSDAPVPEKSTSIAAQTENLLSIARALKDEVSRTTQTTISAAALRHADEIEKLVKQITSNESDSAHR